ncbi:hypothetical protein J6590_058123 [Homalodisca vitripennis]|nr:hypothetical protein J6590_058123 [Homalodisca vitripennis]
MKYITNCIYQRIGGKCGFIGLVYRGRRLWSGPYSNFVHPEYLFTPEVRPKVLLGLSSMRSVCFSFCPKCKRASLSLGEINRLGENG